MKNNFIQRAVTGVLFVIVLVGCILYSPLSFGILFTIINALSVHEFAQLVSKSGEVSINKTITALGGAYLFLALMSFCTQQSVGARVFLPYLGLLLYMMITELYLKKLIVGGFDGVYEFGKNFRNEGMDRTHNPEFTCMEIYVAYKDYLWMMEFTEQMLERVAMAVNGTTELTIDGKPISFKAPFRRLTMTDANNWKQSSFWMRSAAYCRLKNIQLSYTLPRTWLKKLRMKSAMVFVNAQNLFTITDFYQGFDPEVAYSGSGDGVELGAVAYNYPQVKVVTMGVELKF